MRCLVRSLTLLEIGLISLLAASPVLAFPPLPSSFYGTVKVNDLNVPDDTLVQASIGEKVVAEVHTQTYQGDSVYSLDVPGDDTDTLKIEGGKDGDTIMFIIGGIVADQTGIWKSGTLTSLDLNASSTATLLPAEDTHTPVPTATEITLVVETPTSSPEATQFSPTNTIPDSGSSLPYVEVTPTLMIPTITDLEKGSADPGTGNLYTGIVIAGFFLVTIVFIIFWSMRARKPKA
jgi:hypothetical protein